MPYFSMTLMSSRSVSSTPSMCDLTTGSARSRAKLATAYWRVSAISRSVRRRRFFISASVRSSLSLSFAAFLASATAGSTGGSAGAAAGAGAASSVLGASGESAVIFGRRPRCRHHRQAIDSLPHIEIRAAKIKRFRGEPAPTTESVNGGASTGQQFAYHLGGVIDHRDHACVVEPRRPDHADDADDTAGGIVIRRDHGRRAGE